MKWRKGLRYQKTSKFDSLKLILNSFIKFTCINTKNFLCVNTGLCYTSSYEYKNDLVAIKIFVFVYDLLYSLFCLYFSGK